MKDLYERLNLSPDVPGSMIRRRLRQVDNEELERAAREILLHSGRKEVYDRNHRLLSVVGDLRARLDLNDAPNWREGEAYRDFSIASKDRTSQRQTWNKRRNQAGRASRGSTHTTTEGSQGTGAHIASWVWQGLLAIVARFGGFILIIGLCGIISWATEKFDENDAAESPSEQVENVAPSQSGSSPSNVETQEEQQSSYGPPEPLPENGTWWDYTSERQIAPLRISVSSDEHYYIKVVDSYTEARVLTLFIRSGGTAQVEVPLGTYRLKYAVGNKWYGREDLFGSETRYFEAEDTFDFEVTGNQVRGHRIELILQTGGNLSTDRIPEGKF